MGPGVDSHSLNARLLRFRSDPDLEDACALAEDLISARRYGDARGVAVSAQTDDERLDSRLLVLEARAWYLDHDLVRAQAALVRAARLDPDAPEVFRWLGEVLLKRGDPLRALRALERAVALVPDDVECRQLLERASQLAQHAEPVAEPAPVALSSPLPPARDRGRPPVATRAIPVAEPPRPASAHAAVGGAAPALRGGAPSHAAAPASASARPRPVRPAFARSDEDEPTDAFRRASDDFDDMSGGALDDADSATGVTSPGRPGARTGNPLSTSAQGHTSPGRASPFPPPNAPSASSAGVVTRPGTLPGAGTAPSWSGGPTPLSALTGNGTAPGRTAPGSTSPGQAQARTTAGGARSAPGISSPAGRLSPPPLAPPPLSTSSGRLSAPSSAGTAPALRGGASSPGTVSASASGQVGSPSSGAGRIASPSPSSGAGRIASPSPSSGAGRIASPSPSSGAGRLASPLPAAASGRLAAPSSSSGSLRAPSSGSGRLASPLPAAPGSANWDEGASLAIGYGNGRGGAYAHVSQPPVPVIPVDVDVDLDPEPTREPVRTQVMAEAYRSEPTEGSDTGIDVSAFGRKPRPLATSWDAPSVMAPWPLAADPADQSDTDALRRAALGTMDTEQLSPHPRPDLELGAHAGQADDPEQVLSMLRAHGVLETHEARPSVWPPKNEVPRTGMRLRGALLFVWLSALLICGGGYFGWQQWVQHRHARAADLTAQARVAAFASDYKTQVDAERLLRAARELYPRSKEVPQLELFVHAARVLENGNRDLSTLRSALARAGQAGLGVEPAYLAAARAVLAAYSSTAAEANAMLEQARAKVGSDPGLLYLVGRLEQRLGRPEADAHLQAAALKAPELVAVSLAQAEQLREQGDAQAALEKLDAVLQRHPEHVRARLWRAVLTADEPEPAPALAALDQLSEPARLGAPVDRILWGLARARLFARAGQNDKSAEALREALAAGANEPRLLALIAAEALRVSQLGTAQQAASQALALAPSAVAYRVLLARVLLARNDGSRVLDLLAQVPETTPELWSMRARAALQTGQSDAIKAALAQPEVPDAGLEQQALRLRLRAAVEPSSKLLSDAKSMLKRAAGDPEALRAVAEVALAQRQAEDATRASQQLVALMPDDAEAHHWLGRARRMAADAEGAERELRKALELAPGYDGALITLGGLLLDTGKYAEADPIYEQLGRSYVLSGRLGRAEALLGLGRVDDAAVQLSGLPDELKNGTAARETAARVALAQNKPGDAVALLRPLLEGEARRAPALALYGDALFAADQIDSAAGAYDAALELDSELPEARLGRADTYLRAERPKEALVHLDKLKGTLGDRLRPPAVRARMLMQYGHAYIQRDKRDDNEHARVVLREAVKLPGAPAEAYFWLGDALGGRKTPEAAAALKHYLEVAPKGPFAERARRALGPLL